MGLTGLVSQTTHQEDACPTVVVVGSRGETAAATTGSRGCVRSITRETRGARVRSGRGQAGVRADRPGLAGAGPPHGDGARRGSCRRRSSGGWPGPRRPGSPRSWSPASRPGTAGGCSTRSPRELGRGGWSACSRCWCTGPGRAEDFTRNKSDETDAMIIARLVTELRCYLPERAEPALGAAAAPRRPPGPAGHRRHRGSPAGPDLLECAWPAALDAAGKPLESKSWLAAMTVSCWTGSAPAAT